MKVGLKLEASDLIESMRAGDFYASTGVTFKAIHYDAGQRSLRIDIESEDGVTYLTEIIGCLKDGSDPANTGKILATFDDNHIISFTLDDHELYARARITSNRDHPNPSFDGQTEQAWTQPYGWDALIPSTGSEGRAERVE